MEDISRTISALTNMIAVNDKRANTYLSLAEKTDHPDLKATFSQYAKQSKHFINNLATWRSAHGGYAVIDNKKIGGWSLMRTLLDIGRSKNFVSQCMAMEQEALRVYRSALTSSFMPAGTVPDIQRQATEIEKVIEKLKSLKDQPDLMKAVGRH